MLHLNMTEEDLLKIIKRAKFDLLRLERDKMHKRLGLSTALPEMCTLLCGLLPEVSEEVDELDEEDELGELAEEKEEEEEEVVEVSEDTEGDS